MDDDARRGGRSEEPSDDGARSRDLRTGSVARNLIRMTGPMVWGVLAVMSMNLADLYFASRLGTEEVAALGFAFPIVIALVSLGVGLGAGASSMVARCVGADRDDEARAYAVESLSLTTFVTVLVGALGVALSGPLFSLLGAEPDVLAAVGPYMQVWFGGFVLTVFPVVVGAVLRAVGDSVMPSAVMVGSALLNVALDPLLMFGAGPVPALGLVGAAWASLIARLLGAAAMLLVLHRRLGLRAPSSPLRRESWRRWSGIGRIALPAAGSSMANPLGLTVVTGLVASFGTEAVAAFGVANRLESFSVVPLLALSAGIGPVVGQNHGADQHARVRRALTQSIGFAVAWGALLAVTFWVAGEPVARLFAEADEVIRLSERYLELVPITLGGYGAVIVVAAAFNAIGRPVPGFLLSLLRLGGLYVPLAFLGAELFGVVGVFGAAAAANVIGGTAAAVWARRAL